MTTSVPATSTILSFSPKFRIANSLTGSGVRVMTASPTAMTGEDAGPTSAAVSSANPEGDRGGQQAGQRAQRVPQPAAPASRTGSARRRSGRLQRAGHALPSTRRPRSGFVVYDISSAASGAAAVPRICEAGRVSDSLPAAEGPAPGEAHAPPMPTSARVAVVMMGLLAAMLLLYAAITWLGRDGLAEAVGRARPDLSAGRGGALRARQRRSLPRSSDSRSPSPPGSSRSGGAGPAGRAWRRRSCSPG